MQKMSCRDCGVWVDSKDMQDHLGTVCSKAHVFCPMRCGEKFQRGMHKEQIVHLLKCPNWVVVCPVCLKSMQRSDWLKHTSTCKPRKGQWKEIKREWEKKETKKSEEQKGYKKNVCEKCSNRILSYDISKTICRLCFEEKKMTERKRDAFFSALQNPASGSATTDPWKLMAGMSSEEIRERLSKVASLSSNLGGITGITNSGSRPSLNEGSLGPARRSASNDMSHEELQAMLNQVAHDSLVYKDNVDTLMSAPTGPATEEPTPVINQTEIIQENFEEPVIQRARALCSFEGSIDDGSLAFEAGDIFEILDMSDAWWVARLEGVEGLVPSNYVELIPEEEEEDEIEIVIPENATPGSTLNINVDGEEIKVTLPEDKKPGDVLIVKLPAASRAPSEAPKDPKLAEAEDFASAVFSSLSEGDNVDLYVDMMKLHKFVKFEAPKAAGYIHRAAEAGVIPANFRATKNGFMQMVSQLLLMQSSDNERENLKRLLNSYVEFYEFKKLSSGKTSIVEQKSKGNHVEGEREKNKVYDEEKLLPRSLTDAKKDELMKNQELLSEEEKRKVERRQQDLQRDIRAQEILKEQEVAKKMKIEEENRIQREISRVALETRLQKEEEERAKQESKLQREKEEKNRLEAEKKRVMMERELAKTRRSEEQQRKEKEKKAKIQAQMEENQRRIDEEKKARIDAALKAKEEEERLRKIEQAQAEALRLKQVKEQERRSSLKGEREKERKRRAEEARKLRAAHREKTRRLAEQRRKEQEIRDRLKAQMEEDKKQKEVEERARRLKEQRRRQEEDKKRKEIEKKTRIDAALKAKEQEERLRKIEQAQVETLRLKYLKEQERRNSLKAEKAKERKRRAAEARKMRAEALKRRRESTRAMQAAKENVDTIQTHLQNKKEKATASSKSSVVEQKRPKVISASSIKEDRNRDRKLRTPPKTTKSRLENKIVQQKSDDENGFIIVSQPKYVSPARSKNSTPAKEKKSRRRRRGLPLPKADSRLYMRLQESARKAMARGDNVEAERLFKAAIEAAELEQTSTTSGKGVLDDMSHVVSRTARSFCQISFFGWNPTSTGNR